MPNGCLLRVALRVARGSGSLRSETAWRGGENRHRRDGLKLRSSAPGCQAKRFKVRGLERAPLRTVILRERSRASRLPSLRSALRALDPRRRSPLRRLLPERRPVVTPKFPINDPHRARHSQRCRRGRPPRAER